MRFVQLLLTDEQAELTAAAVRDAMNNPDITTDDADVLWRLSLLYQDASETPSKYPPTGKTATSVRRITRRVRGQAQTPSRSKRRADRHQRRRAMRHHFRRNRENAEAYNKAVAAYEAEQAEAEKDAAEIEARIEKQPRFKITDAYGREIMSGVPAEFVIAEESGESLLPKIIVPGA